MRRMRRKPDKRVFERNHTRGEWPSLTWVPFLISVESVEGGKSLGAIDRWAVTITVELIDHHGPRSTYGLHDVVWLRVWSHDL
jgi:hypothetical protein